MQDGDTTASIASECGLTPLQLRMINTLSKEDEIAHRVLHSKDDMEEMNAWDAKKVMMLASVMVLPMPHPTYMQSI